MLSGDLVAMINKHIRLVSVSGLPGLGFRLGPFLALSVASSLDGPMQPL